MEEAEYFFVGLPHPSLVIVYTPFPAERPHDQLGLLMVVARQVGEQVVLDLVLQSAVPEVGNETRFNISGGEHLSSQKVQGLIFIQNQHSFVIGSEDCTVVKPKQTLMD